MKKLIILSIILCVCYGCDDFLDTKDLSNKNNQNFPVTVADLESMLPPVYQCLAAEEYGEFFLSTIASDEAFGGGGPDDFLSTAFDQHKKSNENMLSKTWSNYYTGIFRANTLLESIPKVKNAAESTKKQIEGEACFMRALYHFNLAKVFGEIPVFIRAEQVVKPKDTPEVIYGQIAADLKRAIELFPSKSYTSMSSNRLGHANKWVAESLLARIFLFYTGYYKAQTLPVTGGEVLTKENIIDYLDDVIGNSGHDLAKDFRTLWPYTNPYTVNDYQYTAGKKVKWLGEEGDNVETVFAIKFGNRGSYENSFRNTINIAFALRGQSVPSNCFPFGTGWGQGTINAKMIEQWTADEVDDPRIKMSVFNVDDEEEGIKKYEDNGWGQIHDTHYFNKKYTAILAWKVKGSSVYASYTTPMYGSLDAQYERESQDIVLIRFSDVLLMHAELTETNINLNRVRRRAGLSDIPYSFEALQKERIHELALEGVRYYDLLRWYGKDAGRVLQENQHNVDVLNGSIPGKMSFNLVERISATGGFWPIPKSEISLSKGILKQSEGWDIPSANL